MASRVILASGSPRRRALMALLGLEVEVIPAAVDETPLPSETPLDLVQRLARTKAAAVASRLDGRVVVIGADTTVDLDGEVLGTPVDAESARTMLRRLSGRCHMVHTAVCLIDRSAHTAPAQREVLVSSEVEFLPLEPDLIERYVATGEPLDKAGGYGIQGLGAALVGAVRGSMSSVVGLPMAEVAVLLDDVLAAPGGR